MLEVDDKTKAELKALEQKKYNEWNTKINDYAKEIIELLREKQVTITDFNEVIKVVSQAMGSKVGSLNINYVLNNEPDVEKKPKEETPKKESK